VRTIVPCLEPVATVEIDGETYVRAAPGFSPVKAKKPHVAEIVMKNKYFEEVVQSCPSLTDKCVAITGTTSGTGYWAAMAAVQKGAKAVLLLNRQSHRSKLANDEITAAGGKATAVTTVECDLMSFESVKTAAEQLNGLATQYGGLDVLACNAGVMSVADERTADGFDVQMQVNHLSHALLTKLVMPSLEQAAASRGEARVCMHSSGARFLPLGKEKFATKHMTRCPAGSLGGNSGAFTMMNFAGATTVRYTHSKLANTVYAMALHDQLTTAGSKVKSLAAEPGLATTSLAGNGWQTKPGKPVSQMLMGPFKPMLKMLGQSGPDGACPLILACFGSEAHSGDLYCPSKKYTVPSMPMPTGMYTKGAPMKTILAGLPFKPGKEARSVNAELKARCLAATEAAIA